MNTVDGRNAFTTFKHYISTGSILLSCAQERDLSFKCFFIFFFLLVCFESLLNDKNWRGNMSECVWVLALGRGLCFGKARSTFSLHSCHEIPNVHAVQFNGNHEVPKRPQVYSNVKHKTNLSCHWLSSRKGESYFQEANHLSFFFVHGLHFYGIRNVFLLRCWNYYLTSKGLQWFPGLKMRYLEAITVFISYPKCSGQSNNCTSYSN